MKARKRRYYQKVISIADTQKAKMKSNYKAELKKRLQHRQDVINTLLKRLETIEIDTNTMLLLNELHSVLLAIWSEGDFKRENKTKAVKLNE